MHVIFTDLDGTLLDHETYSWEAAHPAIQRLIDAGIPWLFVTSKTRAETEFWRREMGNQHPFVVENGGAAFVPWGYFPTPIAGARHIQDYELLEWGTLHANLITALRKASEASGCRVRGFHDMSVAEVAETCALPTSLAELAKRREYDEPFTVQDENRAEKLVGMIESQGYFCTRGGRFRHITGPNNKGVAVRALTALFTKAYGPVTTIGLGDGLNDAPLLRQVQVPILVLSQQSEELKKLIPQGAVTQKSGPEGWKEAILSMIPSPADTA